MDHFENARWIWAKDAFGENVYADFFFDAEYRPKDDCRLYISADHRWAVYVNGVFFDCGQYSDLPHFKVYDEIDLSGAMKEGKNVVTVSCWHEGVGTSCSVVKPHGVRFAFEINGRTAAVSDGSTLSRRDARYRSENAGKNQIGLNSVCDLTAPLPEPEPSVEVEGPEKLYPRPNLNLELRDCPPAKLVLEGSFTADPDADDGKNPGKIPYFAFVKPHDRKSAPKILPDAAGGIELTGEKDGCFALFDLGRETVGLIKLIIELPQAADVYMSWGEHAEDGRVRSWLGGRNFTRVARFPEGTTEYIYPFRRAGLRYLQLNVFAPSCRVIEYSVIPTEYPLDRSSFFSCGDSLHERIFEVARRTLELCMHEHYEDCPWREQALYAMDSRNQMLCGYYAFGETRFVRASLELMIKTLRDDRLMEMTAPSAPSRSIPSFNAIYFVSLYEYYLFSGDGGFAFRILDEASPILENFESRMGADGLIPVFDDSARCWNYYEWQTGLGGSPREGSGYCDAPLNAFVSAAFRAAAKLYLAAGNAKRAEELEKKSKIINAALWNAFFVEEKGCLCTRYKDGEPAYFAQLTNALAVYCGAVPEDRLEGVLEKIASGELLPATLSHSIFVYDALMTRPEKYGKYVIDDISRRWGRMLYAGATSFWETEEGADAFSFAGSLCHGWSAVPIYVYFRYVLGLYPGEDRKPLPLIPGARGHYEVKA